MKNTKILNILVGVVMLLGIIFWIRTGMNSDNLESDADLQASVLNPFSFLTLALLIVSIGSAVFFSIANLVSQPEQLKRSLIGLAFMVVILVVAYLLASSEVVVNLKGEELASASVSKWVSTGIWYSIILGVVGVMFFVIDFAKSFIK